MKKIKLSILVPTVPRRIRTFFPNLIDDLLKQSEGRNDVEILGLFDNKTRDIGLKRQTMVDMAQGEYIVFIDDDDRVDPDYIKLIMDTLYANPDADCVVFDSICTIDNKEKIYCRYGIEFEKKRIGDQWRGKPAHTMVYKAEIVKKHKFNSMKYAEDFDWVNRACLDIKKQYRINKVLYFYDSNSQTSEFANL